MSPRLSIVIPTYNAVGQVEPLLDSLIALPPVASGEYEVIVADDASPDRTAEVLTTQYPLIKVVAGEKNLGFGGNCNRGARQAGGEFLSFVNSDIELVGNPYPALFGALGNQTAFAAMPLIHNTALGMIENLAYLYCRRGLAWHASLPETAAWTQRTTEFLAAASRDRWEASGKPIEAVLCGAMFTVRAGQFVALGGFNSNYSPFYWEDVDLGYRAQRLGTRTVAVPSALVIHRHSESIDKVAQGRKLEWLRLNQLRFTAAHRDQLRAAGLRSERLWWLLRGLREMLGGSVALRKAYLGAALGHEV